MIMNEGAGNFVYHAVHMGCLKFSRGSDLSANRHQAVKRHLAFGILIAKRLEDWFSRFLNIK